MMDPEFPISVGYAPLFHSPPYFFPPQENLVICYGIGRRSLRALQSGEEPN